MIFTIKYRNEATFSSYSLFFFFLVADTQLYKRLCPSVRRSVSPSIGNDRVKKWENERFSSSAWVLGIGVWMEVGRPCPTVRNDFVTPRHLFPLCLCREIWSRNLFTNSSVKQSWETQLNCYGMIEVANLNNTLNHVVDEIHFLVFKVFRKESIHNVCWWI